MEFQFEGMRLKLAEALSLQYLGLPRTYRLLIVPIGVRLSNSA